MKKLHPNTDTKVLETIEKYSFEIIEDIEDIKTIFDPESLTKETPTIHKKENAIIIFDHHNYNSAFLHEFFATIIDKKDNIADFLDFPEGMPEHLQAELLVKLQTKLNLTIPVTKIYYCNNFETNKFLFEPFFKSMFDGYHSENNNNIPEFEFDSPPVILMINKDVDAIFMEFEKFMPMTINSAFSSFIIIHDAEATMMAEAANKLEIQKQQNKDAINKHGGQPIPKNPKYKA